MIDRACISINNCCNLSCAYCHFHTKEKSGYILKRDMNVFTILDNIKNHVDQYGIKSFKLGFVGNGEPLLSFGLLRKYIEYISDYITDNRIAVYTITNGTLVTKEMLVFFKTNNVSIGFSIDGLPDIHNKWRCNTFNRVRKAIELYYSVNEKYPPMNCTVGKDLLSRAEETIAFFEQFGSKITFSRMIGKGGISLSEFHRFLDKAKRKLDVRTGGYDCTMYGGKCGAGINNIFYANGKVYLCGNCIDLPAIADFDTPIDGIKTDIPTFDRNSCFKERLSEWSDRC